MYVPDCLFLLAFVAFKVVRDFSFYVQRSRNDVVMKVSRDVSLRFEFIFINIIIIIIIIIII